ncbi:MAG: hypothetical protein ACKVKG_04500, partial [Alphaproteobacteria bacterium]
LYFESETKWGAPDTAPRWTLVDGDPTLLRRAQGLVGTVQTSLADLSAGVSDVPLDDVDGVTASAFFDLVSEAWFDAFAQMVRGVPLLLALSVDGRWRWDPVHGDDNAIMSFLARDQQRDKGFGPAMGGDAAAAMVRVLEKIGYTVSVQRSDWRLDNADSLLLAAMVDGIADAVAPYDVNPEKWRSDRQHDIEQGTLRLCLGHVDILAI